jgi:hypothetical protein
LKWLWLATQQPSLGPCQICARLAGRLFGRLVEDLYTNSFQRLQQSTHARPNSVWGVNDQDLMNRQFETLPERLDCCRNAISSPWEDRPFSHRLEGCQIGKSPGPTCDCRRVPSGFYQAVSKP